MLSIFNNLSQKTLKNIFFNNLFLLLKTSENFLYKFHCCLQKLNCYWKHLNLFKIFAMTKICYKKTKAAYKQFSLLTR